jgi:hypothetical protein
MQRCFSTVAGTADATVDTVPYPSRLGRRRAGHAVARTKRAAVLVTRASISPLQDRSPAALVKQARVALRRAKRRLNDAFVLQHAHAAADRIASTTPQEAASQATWEPAQSAIVVNVQAATGGGGGTRSFPISSDADDTLQARMQRVTDVADAWVYLRAHNVQHRKHVLEMLLPALAGVEECYTLVDFAVLANNEATDTRRIASILTTLGADRRRLPC